MNCEDNADWLVARRKFMKLILTNISHVEIYLSCNVLMASSIQSAKNNGL